MYVCMYVYVTCDVIGEEIQLFAVPWIVDRVLTSWSFFFFWLCGFISMTRTKAWFPYRCICRTCRVCRTKKIHRTDRIHSISYQKVYLSFLLYWAVVREVSIKLYLSYDFFRTTGTTDTTIWKPGLTLRWLLGNFTLQFALW